MNIFVVIPQILVAVCIGFVIESFKGNLAAALAVGSFSAIICKYIGFFVCTIKFFFLAALLVFTLILKDKPYVQVEDGRFKRQQRFNSHEDNQETL